MDQEVAVIKQQHFNALRKREVLLIVKTDYGYEVEQWFPEGVAPTSAYDTPHEAAARALQLLKITEPITPQSWPEVAQIGGEPGDKPPPLGEH
jgi:hypothetical protein